MYLRCTHNSSSLRLLHHIYSCQISKTKKWRNKNNNEFVQCSAPTNWNETNFLTRKNETIWNVRDRECTRSTFKLALTTWNRLYDDRHSYSDKTICIRSTSFIDFRFFFFSASSSHLSYSIIYFFPSVWVSVAERNVVVRFVSCVEHISSFLDFVFNVVNYMY